MTDNVQALSVLIVDDNLYSRSVVMKAVQNLGISKTATAGNGHEALAQVKAGEIDLIICDLNMPEMDGIELLRHIAELEFPGSVVLLSGEDRRILDSVESLAEAHKLNVLGAIEKPLKSHVLAELLSHTADAKRQSQKAPAEIVSQSDLEACLTNNEITLHYQPKVSVETGHLVGTESLVRWQRKDGSMVYPDAFIPAAEEHGLIDAITEAVLEIATAQLGSWRNEGVDLKIAINISLKNLQSVDFPESLAEKLVGTAASPQNIILEVTETQVMQDVVKPLEILNRLRLKGFALSIDDFGTGYSSLEQLKRIPFTEMKIDRAFVTGASKDPSARAILESSISLARSLDMSIVAEGVETQEDWDLIADLGCDVVQGYFISRPMPVEAFTQWAADRAS